MIEVIKGFCKQSKAKSTVRVFQQRWDESSTERLELVPEIA
jgi:hypothetical protein